MQRLLPPNLVIILLLIMTALHLLLPVRQLADRPLIAGLLIAAGLGLLFLGSGLFRRVGTNISTFNKPDKLVTSGPFRFSRNPIYLGFTILLAGVATALGSLPPFIGPVVFFLAAELWYIPFEEEKMEEAFGEDYLAYKSKVRRWL